MTNQQKYARNSLVNHINPLHSTLSRNHPSHFVLIVALILLLLPLVTSASPTVTYQPATDTYLSSYEVTASFHIPTLPDAPLDPDDAVKTVSGGFDFFGGSIEAGINLETTHTRSYDFTLPFRIYMQTPASVQPGQVVPVHSWYEWAATPQVSFSSDVDFATSFYVQGNDVPGIGDFNTGNIQLPDEIFYEFVSLTFGGELSLSGSTSTSQDVAVATRWRNDYFGQPLGNDGLSRYIGQQFSMQDQDQAWKATVDLLGVAAEIYSPIEPIDYVVDLNLSAGIDVKEKHTLKTNHLASFYTFDPYATPDPLVDYNVLMNNYIEGDGNLYQSRVTIPSDATPGQTLNMSIVGSTGGVTTWLEYCQQVSFELGLDIPFFDEWEIYRANVGDEWTVESFQNEFSWLTINHPYFGDNGQFDVFDIPFNIVSDADPWAPLPPDSLDDSLNLDLEQTITEVIPPTQTVPFEGDSPPGDEGNQVMNANLNEDLVIGDTAENTFLAIGNGGTLSNLNAHIGPVAGLNGKVIVDGATSSWTNHGRLDIGNVGEGEVQINNGSSLTVDDTLKIWNNGALLIHSGNVYAKGIELSPGSTFTFNDGLLRIMGGQFIHNSDTLTLAGATPDQWPTLRLSHASTMNIANYLYLGTTDNNGALQITDGSVVTAQYTDMALWQGSQGSLQVSDPGSSLNGVGLKVGVYGQATASITNGAQVETDLWVGVAYQPGSTGLITVSGNNSYLASTNFVIGLAGSGEMIIEDNATAECSDVYLGGSSPNLNGGTGKLTLNDDGSYNGVTVLNVTNTLRVGNIGNGELIINGGTVTSATAVVAFDPVSQGLVTILGSQSSWTVNGSMAVGGNLAANGGSATVDLSWGGSLTIGDTLIIWNDSTVSLHGGGLGSKSMLTAPTIDNRGGNFEILNGTVITELYIGDLTQEGGLLVPQGFSEVGQTMVQGNYTQLQNAGLDFNILGPAPGQYDQLIVEGTAILDGYLTMHLWDTPMPGDTFNVITYSEFGGGTLDVSHNLRNKPAGLWFETIYGPNAVSIITMAVSGDSNLDGTVDLVDLVTLGENYNQPGNWMQGDFTGNGIIDLLDLVTLGEHYGESIPSPEPGTACILAMTACILMRRKHLP